MEKNAVDGARKEINSLLLVSEKYLVRLILCPDLELKYLLNLAYADVQQFCFSFPL